MPINHTEDTTIPLSMRVALDVAGHPTFEAIAEILDLCRADGYQVEGVKLDTSVANSLLGCKHMNGMTFMGTPVICGDIESDAKFLVFARTGPEGVVFDPAEVFRKRAIREASSYLEAVEDALADGDIILPVRLAKAASDLRRAIVAARNSERDT